MSENLSKGNFDTKSSSKSNIEELEDLRTSINVLAEKLKYQDMLRKRLVSDISHEIRTPLNILQNNLEAMIDGIFPASPERLNYLNEEVVRFARLLNNLNALKEFESESVELNFENIELDKMVQAICRDFYISAKNKNIKIDFYARSRQGYVVREDRDKLKQVFINLISNAVKFTEKQGEIHVSLMGSEEQVIVKIKDNGIGIKKEDLPYIFERLYRGDKSRHEIAGSGLGLTIVKNILQFHSANINVESKEGEGTTFKVYFIKNKQISNWRKQTNERAI